jgi:hypothetical protein
MKIFFVSKEHTQLADATSFLDTIKNALLTYNFVEEVNDPRIADALIIHEEYSFKNFNHKNKLLADSFISKYISKLYTINFDDSATGLLKGLYSQIPKLRLNPRLHVAVPNAFYYVNELAFSEKKENINPKFLGSWRGNLFSNKVRTRLLHFLKSKTDCQIVHTNSWWNHSVEEKREYINLILNSKFSLCPAGWTSATFRIYESMALGRCPVIIADNFVPPTGPDWKSFAFFYPENKLKDLHSFLIQNEKFYLQLGLKAKEAYKNFFGAQILPQYYASSLIKLIQSSPGYTNENEVKRWNSLSFQWSNSWTLFQRILNKVKKIGFRKTPEDDPDR